MAQQERYLVALYVMQPAPDLWDRTRRVGKLDSIAVKNHLAELLRGLRKYSS